MSQPGPNPPSRYPHQTPQVSGPYQPRGTADAWAYPSSGPPPPWRPNAARQGQASNGLAVAGLVLGITSIIFCWWGILSITQAILAIVFSSIGIHNVSLGAPRKGMAVAGLVCGIVGLIAYIFFGIVTVGLGFFL